jgi:prepilin-type N-terminal cleavage/methylation domain-containing protein
MRKAFTLIEMMISVVIISIMMLFLYQSYNSLNKSNSFYALKSDAIKDEQMKKRVVYMDFALAHPSSVRILNQDKNEDVIYLQSSNSLHRKYNPYIAYMIKNNRLYRLESLKKYETYPLSLDDQFVVDDMGEVEGFRVYDKIVRNDKNILYYYLIHIDFKKENDVLLKIKLLNEY